MLGRNHRFLGITSTFWGSKCALLNDTTRFDASGARTPDLSHFGKKRLVVSFFFRRDYHLVPARREENARHWRNSLHINLSYLILSNLI